MDAPVTSVLDPQVTAWVEQVTGGKLASAPLVTSGGRLGYSVDVVRGEEDVALFLQRSRKGIVVGDSFMDFEREAEVYRALQPLGVPIPRVWGVDNDLDVLLVDRASGRTWIHAPGEAGEAESVAEDFIGHLAKWHSVPARQLDLPSFAPIRTIAAHQRDTVAAIRTAFQVEDAKRPLDALAWLMLDILENRLPAEDGDPVLVQGDTGPGNLMYEHGRVSAILDWELAHVGDPMDDIAWLSWRATQHGFPDFPARMREYEQASGITVDEARVRYYRVNAVARLGPRFGVADTASFAAPSGDDAAVDRAADGSVMVMTMLHRRMRLTAIAAVLGIELPTREVEPGDDLHEHSHLYDVVLGQLQGIAGRSDDRAAVALAKGAARQVKFLKEIDRSGRQYAARELDDIRQLLGAPQPSLDDGRRAVADAARDGKVGIEDYLLYQWRRLIHDDQLLRSASGSLYERSWPALR